MPLLAGKEDSFPILFAMYTVRYRPCPHTLHHIYIAAGCIGRSNTEQFPGLLRIALFPPVAGNQGFENNAFL